MLALSPPVTLGSEFARFLDATSLEDELEKPMVSLSSRAGTERIREGWEKVRRRQK